MAVKEKIQFETKVPVRYERKKWFLRLEKFMRLFIHESATVCLGEKPGPGCIILSNHEGTKAPLALELYGKLPLRFWGAHEMNEPFRAIYRYQTVAYYHGKKHWNLWLARLFCLLATPLTMLFYRGLELIPTYSDLRFKNTIKQSIQALQQGHTLVIFPEKSDKGYLKELEGFHQGALMLLEQCRNKGLNLPVYVAYYQKEQRRYVFDAPVSVEQLLAQGLSRQDLADQLCQRCNQLGKMEF